MNTQPLITASEAFAAMLQGKQVLARLSFNNEEKFAPLSDYPADIYAKPHVEFCIQIELIEIAGIKFTKPLELDEIKSGEDIFIVNTSGSSIYVVEYLGQSSAPAWIDAINHGFVQRDVENAKLHLSAFSRSVGRELKSEILVSHLGSEKPKAKRTKRTNTDDKIVEVKTEVKAESPPTPDPETIKDIKSGESVIHQSTTSAKTEPNADTLNLFVGFQNQINETFDGSELDKIRTAIFDAGKVQSLNVDQYHKLMDALKAKRESLSTINTSIDSYATAANERARIAEDLINRASDAKTVPEARALIGYTKSWSEEERKPVLDAVNNRIVQIGESHKPNLLDRAMYAKSLEELDQIQVEYSEMDSSSAMYFSIGKAIKDRRVDLGDISGL